MNNKGQIPNISNLHAERNLRNHNKLEIFKMVLNKCIEKITYTNRFTDHAFIFFEVPKILVGFPGYSMNSCILFIKEQLTVVGYKVAFVEPFYLYIDWASPIATNTCNTNTFVNFTQNTRLQNETEELLKKFPGTQKVVFEYASNTKKSKKKIKKIYVVHFILIYFLI